MDTLSERYLDHTPIPIKPLLGSGKSAITFDRVSIEEAVPYAAEDADITLRLWQTLKEPRTAVLNRTSLTVHDTGSVNDTSPEVLGQRLVAEADTQHG